VPNATGGSLAVPGVRPTGEQENLRSVRRSGEPYYLPAAMMVNESGTIGPRR
jgi:hypothetical protein